MRISYRIYPSLLDAYSYYLNSEEIYLRYWGNSENPSKSLDEFEQEQFQGLIDKINRVPMAWEDSEKADRGTVFNELVDCLIAGRKSDMFEVEKVYKKHVHGEVDSPDKDERYIAEYTTNEVVALRVNYNKRTFQFPLSLVQEFAEYFKDAGSQLFVEAPIQTKYGIVEVYGYIDELRGITVYDIKTTSSNYTAWKFKDSAQRLIYPYCLNYHGNDIQGFEFTILVINERKGGTTYESYKEYYNVQQTDVLDLQYKLEQFIEFLETNRNLITNNKIFNL